MSEKLPGLFVRLSSAQTLWIRVSRGKTWEALHLTSGQGDSYQKNLGNQSLHYSHLSGQSYRWAAGVLTHFRVTNGPLAWMNQLYVQKAVVKQIWILKPTKGTNINVVFFFFNQNDEINLGGQSKSKRAEIWPLYEIIYWTVLIHYFFLSSRILRNLCLFFPPMRNNSVEHALNAGLCSLL